MIGTLEDFVPKYLPEADKEALVDQLRDFENRNYYTTKFPSDLLQGDGWFGFDVLNFSDGRKDQIKGIMLSNSCDADSQNDRDLPARIIFAPLVAVSRYVDLLRKADVDADQIGHKIEAIRKQRITSLFFLPKGGSLDEDHIALLDDLHNVPLSVFRAKKERAKIFTLSQMGAYLLILKISMHFCRFSEDIVRD
jgi:hypothetical protein